MASKNFFLVSLFATNTYTKKYFKIFSAMPVESKNPITILDQTIRLILKAILKRIEFVDSIELAGLNLIFFVNVSLANNTRKFFLLAI